MGMYLAKLGDENQYGLSEHKIGLLRGTVSWTTCSYHIPYHMPLPWPGVCRCPFLGILNITQPSSISCWRFSISPHWVMCHKNGHVPTPIQPSWPPKNSPRTSNVRTTSTWSWPTSTPSGSARTWRG